MKKTPEELRDWLEQRLSTAANFDALWRQLEQDHYIGEYRQGEIDEEGVLRVARAKISAARVLLGGHAPTSKGGKRNEEENEPDERFLDIDLSDYEVERAKAYEDVLSREATLNQGPDGSFPIIEWRRRFFGDKRLSLEEAHKFLESPATRFFQPGMFEEWNIPLLGHKAEVVEYDSGAGKPHIDHRATIRIDPPGIVKTICYGDQSEARFDTETTDWHWYFHLGQGVNDGISPEERILRYRDRDGLDEKMRVWPGSVLDSLRSLSVRWARNLGWDQQDMTMWLLTGEPVSWPPLKSKVSYKTGRPLIVSLDVHPWISADTLARNYRKIQHQLFGQDNRPLHSRSLSVLRFVEDRIRESGGTRPSWARLLEGWNEQCRPEWRYENRSNLARTYRESLHSVAHSTFSLPMLRVSPAAQRKAERFNAETTEALTRTMERLAEHGYTEERYDLHGNLLSVTERAPGSLPASDDREKGG